jgi:hypothetical protein
MLSAFVSLSPLAAGRRRLYFDPTCSLTFPGPVQRSCLAQLLPVPAIPISPPANERRVVLVLALLWETMGELLAMESVPEVEAPVSDEADEASKKTLVSPPQPATSARDCTRSALS